MCEDCGEASDTPVCRACNSARFGMAIAGVDLAQLKKMIEFQIKKALDAAEQKRRQDARDADR